MSGIFLSLAVSVTAYAFTTFSTVVYVKEYVDQRHTPIRNDIDDIKKDIRDIKNYLLSKDK